MRAIYYYILTVFLLCFISNGLHSQDVLHVKSVVRELSHQNYHGRCYTQNGANKAAKYIQKKFQNIGLIPVEDDYFQAFSFELNQISDVKMKIDGQRLSPGVDYVVRRNSKSLRGKWPIIRINDEDMLNLERIKKISEKNLTNYFILIDYDEYLKKRDAYNTAMKILYSKGANKFLLEQESEIKDYVGYGRKIIDKTFISLRKGVIGEMPEEINITLKTYYGEIETRNVMAWFEQEPDYDSIMIICGHYDHLGGMGKKAYFPGADDNASAIAVMIELARFMKAQKISPQYRVLFVAFSGEEAGLLGSGFFVKNLPIEKEKIAMVVNLDMVGFGEAPLQVWNGENQKRFSEKILKINEKHNFFAEINVKENSPNSDHYSFTQENLPAVFLTSGVDASMYYHTVFDTYENTPMSNVKNLIRFLSMLVSNEF